MNLIDLKKPQIVIDDVKVLVRDYDDEEWKERYLLFIYYNKERDIQYTTWANGFNANKNGFNVDATTTWLQCKHLPLKKRRLMTRQECLGFIMHLKEPILIYRGTSFDEDELNNPEIYSQSSYFNFYEPIKNYRYRHIDDKGNFTSEPKMFEIEEEVEDER